MNPLFRRIFARPKTIARPKATRRPPLEVSLLEDRANPVPLTVTLPGDSVAGVMDNADPSGNSGDFRYVLTRANALPSNDTIRFDTRATGLFGGFQNVQSIDLTSALPTITGTLTITGPGLNQPLIDPTLWNMTIDRIGGNSFSIFTIAPGATVTFKEFKISGGNAPNGGGISVPDASGTSLTLDSMEVSGNRTSIGAATPANPGVVTPGIPSPTGLGGGGGIYMNGPGNLFMTTTTVSGNTAFEGGGIFISNQMALQIDKSAIINNISGAPATATSTSGGGGIYAGGGPGAGANPFLIVNSTIGGNSAGSDGGGILLSSYTGAIELRNSTVAANSSNNLNLNHGGGGIASLTGATIRLYSSILKNNAAFNGNTAAPKDILTAGSVEEAYSDIFDLNGGAGTIVPNPYSTFSLSTNLNQVDPRLGPLQYNGGRTFSFQPSSTSPVVGSGNNTVAPQLQTDQRGPGFVRGSAPAQFGSTLPDMGSIEVQPPRVLIITPSTPSPTNGTSANFTVYFNQPVTSLVNTNFTTGAGTQSPTATGSINPGFILVGTPTGITSAINPSNPFFAWNVPLTSINGDGTVSLNMTNSSNATPAFILAQNPAGALPFIAASDNPINPATGSQYPPSVTVDQTAPKFVAINTNPANNPPPVMSGPLTWTVTFSDAPAAPGGVRGLTPANFGFVNAGSANETGAVTVTPINPLADGSSLTWQVTTNFSGNGTIGLQMINANGVTDRAGNALGGAYPQPVPASTYVVGRPVVLSIIPVDASNQPITATNQTTVNFLVTFNQVVSGVSVNDFKLTVNNVTANIQSVTPATGFNRQYTVTVAIGGLVDQTQNGTISVTMNSSAGTTPQVAEVDPPTFPNGFPNPTPVIVDYNAPTLQSPLNELTAVTPYGSATNASTVQFGLVFNEAVQGVPQGDLQLTGSAASAATITGVTRTGPNTFTVTVAVPANLDGTLGLSVVSATGILDTAGNTLQGIPPAVTETGGTQGPYNVDTTPPTAATIGLVDASPTNAPNSRQLPFLATFSEPVFGLSTSNFRVVATGSTYNGGGVLSVTPVNPLPNGSSANWQVIIDAGFQEGTLGVTLNNSTNLTDKGGSAVTNVGVASATYTVDTIPPDVLSTVPLGANPGTPPSINQGAITFQVTFREAVNGLTKANFQLTSDPTVSGATITGVTQVTGSTFNVTVSTGTGDGNITLALANSNGLADLRNNPVPLPDPDAVSVVRVDKTSPVVVSIKATDSTTINAPVVRYRVTFSEAVTGLTPASFTLNTSGLTGANVPPTAVAPVAGSNGTQFDVSVVTGTGTGTLQLNLTDVTGIKDLSTNPLLAGATGDTYTIDLSAPSVTSITPVGSGATNAATVQFDVKFNSVVSGVKASSFTLGVIGPRGAQIVGTPTPIGSLVAVPSGTASDVWRVTASTGTGDGTLQLNLTDATGLMDVAGNQITGVPVVGTPVIVDKTAPTVTIIPAPSQPNPANSEPVRFTVVFNEPVFGFGSGGLVIGGTAGAGIATVTGNPGGTTYSVTVGGLTQSGQVSVTVVGSAASDRAGNASSGSAPAAVNYNRPVPARPDEYSTKAKAPLAVAAAQGVLVNDGDAISPARVATLVAAPAAGVGSVALGSDGSFTFVPAPGFSGDAVFTYTATDGVGISAPTTVTIRVGPRTILTATSAGAGGGPQVTVVDANGSIVRTFFAYDPSFTGGVQVAAGDVTGDATDDIVVGTGVGGGPNVVVFEGKTGAQLTSFFAYESSFRGGVQVAVGDVNGDGFDDIVTGTGVGGGPRIQVFYGKDMSLIANFFAYDSSFRGGVNVAVGDVDGDGIGDILASPVQGGGPHVAVFQGAKGNPSFPLIRSFFAFDPGLTGGVSVAVGDAFGDGKPDIIAASSVGASVVVFSGPTATPTAVIPVSDPQPTGGLRLATKDTTNDGLPDQLLMASGPGDLPRVERFNLTTMTRIDEIMDFPLDFRGGLYVG